MSAGGKFVNDDLWYMHLALAPGVCYHCAFAARDQLFNYAACVHTSTAHQVHHRCDLLHRQIRLLIMLPSEIRFGMIQLLLCLCTLLDKSAILQLVRICHV